jgi:hypothetical protein
MQFENTKDFSLFRKHQKNFSDVIVRKNILNVPTFYEILYLNNIQ